MCAFLLPAFGLISAYEIRSGLLGLALPFVCTCGGDERARDGIQPSGKKLQNPLEKPHPAPSAVLLPPLVKILCLPQISFESLDNAAQ